MTGASRTWLVFQKGRRVPSALRAARNTFGHKKLAQACDCILGNPEFCSSSSAGDAPSAQLPPVVTCIGQFWLEGFAQGHKWRPLLGILPEPRREGVDAFTHSRGSAAEPFLAHNCLRAEPRSFRPWRDLLFSRSGDHSRKQQSAAGPEDVPTLLSRPALFPALLRREPPKSLGLQQALLAGACYPAGHAQTSPPSLSIHASHAPWFRSQSIGSNSSLVVLTRQFQSGAELTANGESRNPAAERAGSAQASASESKCTPSEVRAVEEEALGNKERASASGWTYGDVVNWPNAISMARLLSGPPIALLIVHDEMGLAVAALSVAALSDWLDGYVARRKGELTVLGTYLDPLADKVLIACVSVAMVAHGLLPLWLVGLVLARDGALLAGAFVQRAHALHWQWRGYHDFFDISPGGAEKMRPLLISKLNTVAQLALVASALLLPALGIPDTYNLVTNFGYLVAFTTVLSGSAYAAMHTYRLRPSPRTLAGPTKSASNMPVKSLHKRKVEQPS